MSPNTKLPIIFGAMTFGKADTAGQTRTTNLSDCAAILDTFQKHNHNEIDTSRIYGEGTSEEYLAALDWKTRALVMDTKYCATPHGLFGQPVSKLNEKDTRAKMEESLKALGTESVDLWYLHTPDRTTPIEETLKVVNDLYKERKFKNWGVSNYMAWEVAAICEICEAKGYVKPSVYQGLYNAIHRTVENELFPCLRKYGMSFYAFNPLAGGYLTDRYHREDKDEDAEPGSRFDPKKLFGRMYRQRYWSEKTFDALDLLRAAAKKHGLGESECALRWMMHHSQLKKELGDKVIIGASSEKQLRMNLKDFEREELSADVLEALNQGWELCRGNAWKYFH
ncbi:NADP-dependent oxidoreductase domain-containing protein [Lophiotrema nucula]|uniref:NADP-dependent oxidoreductase domain-containing protein n=1 Tax=Lophiotrema nucula TaxID=690887 RepID=A0A6A5YTG4_9PLEO|nr:NADP-dependent oxidoreductase domain-containing protein [Lophiotrema nucula]